MTFLRFAAESAVTEEITLEFPNLFGGTEIKYYRGFELFGLPIYWYGILIAVGIVIAYVYAIKRSEKDFGLHSDRAFDVIFASIIGGFLGARIYYCVFKTLDPASLVKYDFVSTFTQIRDGGLAIYGGIIGALLTGFLFCKIRKVKFFTIIDIAALGFLIGQTIGRWGNFVNQEAYGADAPADWLFAMKGTLITSQGQTGVVHPCFLYESLWCLIGFVLLHIYSKKLRSFDGELMLLYISWYGLGRFFIESLRTDSLMAGSLKVSQVVAAVSFVLAMAAFVFFKFYTKRKNIPLYVNSEAGRSQLLADKQAESKKRLRRLKKDDNEAAPSILGEDEDEENDENNDENSPENDEKIPENSDENKKEEEE